MHQSEALGKMPGDADVVQGQATLEPDGRIVVGFDGSEGAWGALRWAADEAGRRRALLEVVSCLSRGPLATWVRGQVDEATRIARSRGWQIPVRAAFTAGTPGSVLVARAQGASMLVIGRHRAPAGVTTAVSAPESLSAYCVTHAQCPVVVVESPSQPAHDIGATPDARPHGVPSSS